MKIGILTFHRALNYGAVLQAYALQDYLRKQGLDAKIIDYRQPFIESQYACFSIRRCLSKNPLIFIYHIMREILNLNNRIGKKRHFRNFSKKYLRVTSKVFHKDEIPQDMDLYLHGSDQIWNAKLTGGYDLVYFGKYPTKHGLKASYAASMENREYTKSDGKIISEGLAFLDVISVREKGLIKLLKPYTEKNIVQVVDPTLLTDRVTWDAIVSSVQEEEEYIFIYVVGIQNNQKVRCLATKVANRLGVKKIIDCKEKGLSPEEFVSYIKNAKFIITDSFHATVFSIIYHRDFYTVASNLGSDLRFTSLLDSIGLEDRVVYDNVRTVDYIDYRKLKIDERLSLYTLASKQFLQNILNK
ncbi:polysaccharide pyruvyl transferase family protein [Bacteroides sp. An19]|uniref:polysaccharide pyruvyl transferase family protein n=1 Tax=Bacteroides sp. An19 TaxID=1965580 RepID=UPI000B3AC72D|nr:polysaccharide pyruvyl transferase family protein [Bacteroides sp. An19]OUP32152.1 hypothetical protein B5F25_09485 [Bacteroides sp. An19]